MKCEAGLYQYLRRNTTSGRLPHADPGWISQEEERGLTALCLESNNPMNYHARLQKTGSAVSRKKKQRNKGKTPSMNTAQASKHIIVPMWLKVVRALSLAGVLLTAYLAWQSGSGGELAFCEQGSSCSIIQGSQWSKFMGIPLALWGMGLYVLIALSSFGRAEKVKQWQRLWKLSFLGALISTYLTITGVVSLDAVCGWCLVSYMLLGAIFGIVMINKPAQGMGRGPGVWWISHALVGLGVIGMMFVSSSGVLSNRGDPRLHELAQHLSQKGRNSSWMMLYFPTQLIHKGIL